MTEQSNISLELPNFIRIIENRFPHATWAPYLGLWENMIFSMIIVLAILVLTYFATRKQSLIPGRLQNAAEILIGGLDEFIRGILGPKGRKYTPFIGTLFIYILFMNLFGLIPLMKSPTSSWSTTLALALCVFGYVQYTSIKELGVLGYLDHLAGKPRGALAWNLILPLFILIVHLISELIRPISLSLRLRGNIWGDEALLAVLSGLGIKGLPLLFFNTLMAILTAILQAVVFSLLSTIYFALVLTHEEEHA